jgi:hypothetical protein
MRQFSITTFVPNTPMALPAALRISQWRIVTLSAVTLTMFPPAPCASTR